MTSSKPTPSSLNHFLNTPHSAHRDLTSSTPSRPTSSFRTVHQQTGSSGRRGTDDDWGRFATSYEPESSSSFSIFPPIPGGEGTSSGGGVYSNEGLYEGDGDAVKMMLRGGSSMTEDVYGDWEEELREERRARGNESKFEWERAIPVDPLANINDNGKGKGRAVGDRYLNGEATDEELISSLSSLSLKDKKYLESLIALPEDQSISNYLRQGRYTDDIYALPSGVQKLLDQAAQGETEGEEGKKKALRRLAMVMQHLFQNDDDRAPSTLLAHSTFAPYSNALIDQTTLPIQNETGRRSETMKVNLPRRPLSWTEEYPLLAQHSPPISRSEKQMVVPVELESYNVRGAIDINQTYEDYLRGRQNSSERGSI